jgi:cation transport regulator
MERIMAYQNLEELPQEVNQMPQGAKQIFMAAFNAAEHDGMSQNGATEVAWNSVKSRYYQGDDGKWQIRTDDGFRKSKIGVVAGGN